MCITVLSNPTVIGAIIGALIGAIASTAFAITFSWYKFNKRKNGVKALIKSEINYIIKAFEKFREKYVKNEIKLDDKPKNNKDLSNFYYVMQNFPIWTNRNWINLISFIPSIFQEEDINKINNFYTKCEEVSDIAKVLSNKEPYYKLQHNEKFNAKLPMFSSEINRDREMFRKELNDLIKLGYEVKKIFE